MSSKSNVHNNEKNAQNANQLAISTFGGANFRFKFIVDLKVSKIQWKSLSELNVLFSDREMALKSIKIQVISREFEKKIRIQKFVW